MDTSSRKYTPLGTHKNAFRFDGELWLSLDDTLNNNVKTQDGTTTTWEISKETYESMSETAKALLDRYLSKSTFERTQGDSRAYLRSDFPWIIKFDTAKNFFSIAQQLHLVQISQNDIGELDSEMTNMQLGDHRMRGGNAINVMSLVERQNELKKTEEIAESPKPVEPAPVVEPVPVVDTKPVEPTPVVETKPVEPAPVVETLTCRAKEPTILFVGPAARSGPRSGASFG